MWQDTTPEKRERAAWESLATKPLGGAKQRCDMILVSGLKIEWGEPGEETGILGAGSQTIKVRDYNDLD